MSKKVLSFVLSVLLIMNVAGFAISAAPAPDVKGTAFSEAATILTDMGIMSLKEDGNFSPAGDITVGEYMDAVLKLIGVNASDVTPQARFTDVPVSHTYAKQVEMAYQLNIYKGKSADSYGVDDKLTIDVALKALLNATGYGEYAKVKGGEAYGYALVANEKDIINNVPAGTAAVTRGAAADMLYNALFLNVMIPSTNSKGETTYTEDDSRTILSSIHGAYEDTGVMTSNAFVTLPAGKGLPAGNVKINGSDYATENISADQYLGYNVTAIYTTDKGVRSLIALAPTGAKNNVLTYDLDDIQSITPDEVVYYPEDAKRETTIDLTKFAPVLNNFSLASIPDGSNYIIPACGDVTIIDNDNDGKYDLVLIDSYETMVVSSIDKVNTLIYGKYNDEPVDLSMYDNYSIKDPTGKVVKLSEVKKDDIAMIKSYPDLQTVRAQKSGLFVEVQLLRTMETVTVEEITSAGDSQYPNQIKFKFAGKEYEVAASFYTARAPSAIELGAQYDIYLDIKGKIANMVKKGSESLQFGYLVKGAVTSSGVDNTLELKLYTLKGEFITVKSGEKLVYSGDSGDAAGKISSQKLPYEIVHKYLYNNNGSGFNDKFNSHIEKDSKDKDVIVVNPYSIDSKVGGMAIRYRLAEDNTLLTIETAFIDKFADGFRQAGSIAGGGDGLRYKNTSKLIGGVIMMGTDTKCLDVALPIESDKESSYSTKFTIVNEAYYQNLKAYSTTLDSAAAQYITHETGAVTGSLDENDPAYVFVKYTETYDPATEKEGKGIVLYDNGDFVTYAIDDTTPTFNQADYDAPNPAFVATTTGKCFLDDEGYLLVASAVTPYNDAPRRLEPGDVIRPVFNGQNQIMSGTSLMFDVGEDASHMKPGISGNGLNANLVEGVQIFWGSFERRLGNGGYGRPNRGTVSNSIYNFDTAKSVVVVDLTEKRESRQFARGSVDDIKTQYEVGPDRASDVFAFIREGAFKLVVIYKRAQA